MPYSTHAKNLMLDSLGVTHVSAHTAIPDADGSGEVSGGAYARKSITYGGASAGAKDSTNQPELDIPAGTTVQAVGYWTAVTGGTFLGYTAVTETYTNAGTLTVADSDLDLNS